MAHLPQNYGSMADRQPVGLPAENEDQRLVRQPLLPGSDFKLYNILKNPEKRGPYLSALACKIGVEAATLINATNREVFALLSALQLSGILNTRNTNLLLGSYYNGRSYCPGYREVWFGNTIQADSAGASFGEVLNSRLGSIDTFTYVFAGAWAASHAALPKIQRVLKEKEQKNIKCFLEKENLGEVLPPATTASKVGHLLEYAMPLFFDAARYTILMQTLQNTESEAFVPIGFNTNAHANFGDANISTDISIDYLISETDLGQSSLPPSSMYAFLGVGVSLYAAQALCNFHHQIKSKGENEISLKELAKDKKKLYASAMFFYGVQKGLSILKELSKSSVATMTGLQFSGFLDAKIVTTLIGAFMMSNKCPGQGDAVSLTPFLGNARSHTMRGMIDSLSQVSVDELTYAAAIGWVAASIFIPPIQRLLKTKEDALLRQILENQYKTRETDSASLSSNKFDTLSDLIMPVAFDGAMFGLFLQLIQQSNNAIHLLSNQGEIWSQADGNFITSVMTGIYDVLIEVISEGLPLPLPCLWLVFGAGAILYTYKAWRNFHNDLKNKTEERRELPQILPAGLSPAEDEIL